MSTISADNGNGADLEKAEELPQRDSTDSSSTSSRFSWHHSEGPRSIRDLTALRTLSRVDTVQTQAESVVARIRSRAPRAPFTHPLTHEKTAADVIVNFDGPDDPYRPLNWPVNKKIMTTFLYGLTTMTTSFASSVYSSAERQVSGEFHIGIEVASLGTALLLFGMGLGPLLWGPLSEVYGRKAAVIWPVFIAGLFSFGAGAAKDVQTLMICRFFVGFFGSAPVTNTGGVLGDVWSAQTRGLAIVGYSLSVVGGPTLGPLVGSAITVSSLRWRWTQYITGIFEMVMVCLDLLILDESYPAALLVIKARRLRHESGNWALHAKHEEWDVSIKDLANKYLIRPFQLLSTPICAMMAFYASFTYGLIYGCLAAFPIVFEEKRGWPAVTSSCTFLALLVGILFACVVNASNQRLYAKAFAKNGNRPVPEARLYPMMLGGPFLTGGIFMLAWTAPPRFHWILPCIGIAFIGFGFFQIFQSAINYLVDTFTKYSASAIAANTFLRSCFAGSFPLFVTYQLHGIGVGWGLSVFGFLSALCIPVPVLFYIYGKQIRSGSAWSRDSV